MSDKAARRIEVQGSTVKAESRRSSAKKTTRTATSTVDLPKVVAKKSPSPRKAAKRANVARREDDGPIRAQVFASATAFRRYADKQVRDMLGMSYEEAMESLARGELEGTLAETRLKLLSAAMS